MQGPITESRLSSGSVAFQCSLHTPSQKNGWRSSYLPQTTSPKRTPLFRQVTAQEDCIDLPAARKKLAKTVCSLIVFCRKYKTVFLFSFSHTHAEKERERERERDKHTQTHTQHTDSLSLTHLKSQYTRTWDKRSQNFYLKLGAWQPIYRLPGSSLHSFAPILLSSNVFGDHMPCCHRDFASCPDRRKPLFGCDSSFSFSCSSSPSFSYSSKTNTIPPKLKLAWRFSIPLWREPLFAKWQPKRTVLICLVKNKISKQGLLSHTVLK
jgi:hypothetical protein